MILAKQKSFMANASNIERKCFVIDADGKILGKIAAKAAVLLRGKHKPTYTPHADMGDSVVIINAEKIRVTGNKLAQKEYQRYSGFPSGQRRVTLGKMLEKRPTKVLELAVKRMIPSGPLGNSAFKRLKVYTGPEHPHAAQKPELVEI